VSDAARTSPFRDDLCRSAPFELIRATEDGTDGLTIEGYGAVFDSPTQIRGWEGEFEEIIAPGAFRKSLRERTPRMQFDHGQHPLLGSLPLGRWTTAQEDERGLHLVGRLTDNWLVAPFRDAIRDGGVEGMSFRFAVVRDEWVDAQGKKVRDDELAELLWHGAGDRGPLRRTLREVKASEAGPVVWPAYQDTTVGVRARGNNGMVVIDLHGLRSPETRRQLADLVALADRETQTSDAPLPRASVEENEPQATATRSADDHPAQAEPEVTERAAGEHSSPARPANPTERSRLIKAEYRARLNRLLALTPDTPNPEECA